MTDSSIYTQKIRHLSFALIFSGVLNIGVLSLLLYWVLKEQPPTPYCELKPASFEQEQIPLADQRGCAEVLTSLSQLSFHQLISHLSRLQMIENGYAERDLALACLVAFHHFDIERGLPKNGQPQQKRFLAWKQKGHDQPVHLVVYPDLTQNQFDSLIQFAKTERWPLTAEGLFTLLKEQNEKKEIDKHLIETFMLTPEFWTVELLFHRSSYAVSKEELLGILLEGNWLLLKQFVDQQRQINDSSDARRQKFLLDYVKGGSPSSVIVLLKNEWDFAVKKLDDLQVISILQLPPNDLPEAIAFAKEMLASPRNTSVWRYASEWLYHQAGESAPKEWTHHAALLRFVPDKASTELVSKPIPTPSVIAPQLTANAQKVKNVPPPSKPPSVVLAQIDKKPTPIKKQPAKEPVKKIELEPILYTIREGDNLWKIAQRFGVKVDEIKALNQMKSDALKVGTVLKIPRNK